MGRTFLPLIYAGRLFHEALLRERISMFYEDKKHGKPSNGKLQFYGMGMLNEQDAEAVRLLVRTMFESKVASLERERRRHNQSVKDNE
jgi:hypothetical protein